MALLRTANFRSGTQLNKADRAEKKGHKAAARCPIGARQEEEKSEG